MVSAGGAVCSKFRMCRMQAEDFASGRRSGGPFAEGGNTELSNAQLLHSHCNQQKATGCG